MPQVTIKTGFSTADGKEEILTEYLCDWPGCANIAVHTLGCIKEIRTFSVVCREHIPPRSGRRPPNPSATTCD
jgi:hypothetical protein